MQEAWQPVGMVLGASLCALALMQMATRLSRWWLRTAREHRQYEKRRAAFGAQVQAALRRAQARRAQVAWEGLRPFRVAAVVDEAIDVKSFYLTAADGLSLPPFEPGQYLTFHLDVPGATNEVVRCYSLSDRPRTDYYRVTVKWLAAPADRPELPAGLASHYLHDSIHVGDILQVAAPRGTFILDPLSDRPIVLIGAGIGITPLLSMLNTIVENSEQREVHMLLGMQNGRHHPFKDHLEEIAGAHDNVHYHASYSTPLADDRIGVDYQAAGRISLERIRKLLPSNNYEFYVCGPGEMMQSLVPQLLEWGVPEEHIHYEAFGPASVKIGAQGEQLVDPCEVCFAQRGCSFTWDGSYDSLLEFGEANGVEMLSGCRAGNCGQCLTGVKSGNFATLRTPGVPVETGYCLTCVSVPAGPLVLDT